MGRFQFYQVDAFSPEPFRGNPAAVCLMEEFPSEEIMRNIAMEMNLSETAFAVPDPAEKDVFQLRWFTPCVEVSLCGHATLATSRVIFDRASPGVQELSFRTKSGLLKVRQRESLLVMDFPKDYPEEADSQPGLLAAMGLKGVVEVRYGPETGKLLVRVNEPEEVLGLRPDFRQMLESENPNRVSGVIVTAGAWGKYDFVSRYFAPWKGVNEDPVTGSAHTLLTPYWSEVLGKTHFRAFQASRRGGELVLSLADDRVFIAGAAVIVARGELWI